MAPENKSPCPECKECKGLGYTLGGPDGTTQKECRNVYYRRLGSRLGVEIATAAVLTESPLYVPSPEPGAPPTTDLTKKNLYLKGWWSDLTSHFKWTFICKFGDVGLEAFRFHIVTDERLVSVWLSKEAYTSKARKKREEIVTFNNLAELIGDTYTLVIIRLGFMGHKNVALPGVLKEALMVRQAAAIPTWIVEEPESPFAPGHFAYSPEVMDYITQRFEVLDLKKDRPERSIYLRGVEGAKPRVESDTGMGVDEVDDSSLRRTVAMPLESFAVDPLLGGGYSGKKKYTPKKRGGGQIDE